MLTCSEPELENIEQGKDLIVLLFQESVTEYGLFEEEEKEEDEDEGEVVMDKEERETEVVMEKEGEVVMEEGKQGTVQATVVEVEVGGGKGSCQGRSRGCVRGVGGGVQGFFRCGQREKWDGW